MRWQTNCMVNLFVFSLSFLNTHSHRLIDCSCLQPCACFGKTDLVPWFWLDFLHPATSSVVLLFLVTRLLSWTSCLCTRNKSKSFEFCPVIYARLCMLLLFKALEIFELSGMAWWTVVGKFLAIRKGFMAIVAPWLIYYWSDSFSLVKQSYKFSSSLTWWEGESANSILVRCFSQFSRYHFIFSFFLSFLYSPYHASSHLYRRCWLYQPLNR